MLEVSVTPRRLAWLLPLPLLCALGAWGSVHVADRIGGALGRALAAVAPFLVNAAPQTEPEPEPEDSSAPFASDALVPVAVAAPAKAPAGKGRSSTGKAKGKAEERVIVVSATTVLRLAESRARPRGVAVKSSGARPAGLRLAQVAGLGIGLQDGDVLTRAVGQPATSSSAVVQAILIARAKGARVLEGEFWRGSERWVLRVEQPYLSRPETPSKT
jgi:hypothetical protein